MKKRILSLMLVLAVLLSLGAAVYAAEEEENHPSVTYRLLTGASAEIVDAQTGEPLEGAGAMKIIINYGDKELIVDTDGTAREYDRSSTVANFSTMDIEEIPQDLTAEEISAIYGDAHDIEEEEIPVIAITGFDTMLFANDLVDHVSAELTVPEKSGIQTITGLDYSHGVLVDLAYQLSQNNETARELLTAFDDDKVLLKDVKSTITANKEKLQATLEEKIQMVTEEMSTLDASSAEYSALSKELQEAQDKLAETEKEGYEDLTNYTPMTILDISMNSKARALLGENGAIRIYLSIDGVDYEDEIIMVNTHATDVDRAIDEVEKASQNGTEVSESTIEEIFDECRVNDCYVTPAAVQPDGTVREISINEMDTAVLAEDEILQPRVNLEIVRTSPFLVLMRNRETSLCSICNYRAPLFLGVCWCSWTVAAIALVFAGYAVGAAVKKNKKTKAAAGTGAAAAAAAPRSNESSKPKDSVSSESQDSVSSEPENNP